MQDDSGFITPDELRDALIKHGMDVEGMDDILNDVDQDGDGRINYDEFVHMMRSSKWSRLVVALESNMVCTRSANIVWGDIQLSCPL